MIEKSGRPAYLQIADEIRARILSGDLSDGQALPSTAQLTSQYSVSASVVKAAISVLRTEGYVIGQQGKGVFVRIPTEATSEVPAAETTGDIGWQLTEILSTLRDLSTRMARLEAEVFPTPPRTPPDGS